MGIGRGMAAPPLGVVIIVMVIAALPTPGAGAAGSAAVDQQQGGRRPCCFHACFDQCVLRDEFWFCQFSCYHRCAAAAGSRAAVLAPPGRDCEHSCALSMCGQLRPGSKMMAVCRDTCRKSYAVADCRVSRER